MTDEQILDKIAKLIREESDVDDVWIGVLNVMKHRQPRGWRRIFKP